MANEWAELTVTGEDVQIILEALNDLYVTALVEEGPEGRKKAEQVGQIYDDVKKQATDQGIDLS